MLPVKGAMKERSIQKAVIELSMVRASALWSGTAGHLPLLEGCWQPQTVTWLQCSTASASLTANLLAEEWPSNARRAVRASGLRLARGEVRIRPLS